MVVFVSLNADKKNKVYHKQECFYAKRMRPKYRMSMDEEKAIRYHYRECKYCAGLQGEVKIRKNSLKKKEKANNMQFVYDEKTDTFYIATQVGFWKIFTVQSTGEYVLYHRNQYEKGMALEEAKHGEYHRQRDMRSTASFEKILNYVIAHDKAKVIIQNDYRKLPQSTKKQKKYYEIAKRKEQRREIRRVRKRIDELFSMIETKGNQERAYSCCS